MDNVRDPQAIRQQNFRATLGQRRGRIVERWIELRMVRWSRPGIDQLRGWVLELAEQSVEFGHVGLGDLARELLHRVEGVVGDYPPYREVIGAITGNLERLNLQIDQVQLMAAADRSNGAAVSRAPDKPKVVLAGVAADVGALIEMVLGVQGMQCVTVSDAAGLHEQLRQRVPNLLIVDEALAELADRGSGAVRAAHRFDETPWILLAEHADAELKLRALGAGACACLDNPVDLQELVLAAQLAVLPLLQTAVTVQIMADTPELAKRHAESLKQAGLSPLLGLQSTNLPDLWCGHAVDAVLLDMSFDTRQRDVWLSVLADTAGFACVPVICLMVQNHAPACRHRRTLFLPAPVPDKQLVLALRKAALENQRDALRMDRSARIRQRARACSREEFMRRLSVTVTEGPDQAAQRALVAVALDDPLGVLRDHGSAGLAGIQERVEHAAIVALGEVGICTRFGSAGAMALFSAADTEQLHAYLIRLAQLLEAAVSESGAPLGDSCSAVLLPLNKPLESAQQACRRVQSALADAREAGGGSFRVIELDARVSAVPPSPLPVERMYLQVCPLTDRNGAAQSLHNATIQVRNPDGSEQPLGALLAEVVSKGLATQLDVWEMNAAADQMCTWPEGPRGIEIAMRLSAASRESVMLAPLVRQAVSKLPAGRGFRLVFEVAEHWLVEHNVAAVEMVEALRGLGCGVMLGDFGASDNPRNLGWASWFDYARLSNSRLAHVTADDERRAPLEKLIRSASSRGARIISGPIGDAQTRALLAEWGVSLFE